MSKQISKSKKGGPYTTTQKAKRRDAVYKYHFGYNYSARKISQIMKVNRNTVNRDINYLYSQVDSKISKMDMNFFVAESLEKLNLQKTRLCEMINYAESSEKLSLEKLILQIESQIIQTKFKLINSKDLMDEFALKTVDSVLKKNKQKGRLISTRAYWTCSEKAKERIEKILKEDQLL